MRTTAAIMLGALAVANAAVPKLKGRAEAVGATPDGHPQCALTSNNGSPITGFDPDNLAGYMDDLKQQGTCEVAAGKCNRVTCGNTSAIYVCNDNDYDIAPGCATVAEWVGDPLERTGDGGDHVTQACGCSQYSCDEANGELTFQEGWRIQVGYGNCNHPADSEDGIYEE